MCVLKVGACVVCNSCMLCAIRAVFESRITRCGNFHRGRNLIRTFYGNGDENENSHSRIVDYGNGNCDKGVEENMNGKHSLAARPTWPFPLCVSASLNSSASRVARLRRLASIHSWRHAAAIERTTWCNDAAGDRGDNNDRRVSDRVHPRPTAMTPKKIRAIPFCRNSNGRSMNNAP